MVGEKQMNADELWTVLDKERLTSFPQQLPDNFIHNLQLYIANLELGISGKEELRAARRRVVNIIQRREGKIVKLAVANAKIPETLLETEESLFEQIREACATFEESMLKELNGEKE